MAGRLSEEERRRISAAIEAAEKKTAGEIYCVIAHTVSDYRFVPLIWAALIAFLLPALLLLLGAEPHRWPILGEPWSTGETSEAMLGALMRGGTLALVLAQAILFVLVIAATAPMPIRLGVTPRSVKAERVHRAAVGQFLARGLQNTRDRTGVLIFVSLAERQAEVVADEGIYAKVDETVWNEAVCALVARAREGRLADGMVEAVQLCGNVLAQHFPPRPDDVNELPDRVVEL
jgi:putative membrane protein